MQLTLPVQLPAEETFTSYYAGGNENIVAFLQTLLTTAPKRVPITLLSGESGTGKSHLLHSVCHAATQHSKTSMYLNFANLHELVPEMLEGMEHINLICMDDIHHIFGNREWEIALFDLINRVLELASDQQEPNAQLLLTQSSRNTEHKNVLPDLVSRLQWGSRFALQPPSDEEKLAIIQLRAEQRGLTLNLQTLRYLLNHGQRDVGSLIAVLAQLDDESLVSKNRISIAMLKQVLSAAT